MGGCQVKSEPLQIIVLALLGLVGIIHGYFNNKLLLSITL